MTEIIISNFVTIGMIIGFTLQLVTGNLFDKKAERLFAIGIFVVLLLVCVDIIDHLFEREEQLISLRYITSSAGYILRPGFICVIISILLRDKGRVIVLWVPLIILSVIVLTSPFTHLMFYFDEYNNFYRGPLGFASHILSGGYLVALLIITLKMYKIIDKREVYIVLYILIFHATATIVESVFGRSFLLTGAMIASIALYYIYLYVQVYKFDELTGFLNRRSFYAISRNLGNNSIVVISIDLNNLKIINDTRGHLAGDKAICTVSDILREYAGRKFQIYRVGGDEFMVLGINQGKKEAEFFIENSRRKLNKTEYRASFGYAMYTPDRNFENVCHLADMAMYKDKESQKMGNI